MGKVNKHLSPTCRAARSESIQRLPSAKLLRAIDDSDLDTCRKARNIKVSWLAWILLIVPATFAIFGDFLGDISLEIMTPTLWTGFVVGNDTAMQINPWMLYLFYGSIFAYFFVNYYILKPMKRRRTKKQN